MPNSTLTRGCFLRGYFQTLLGIGLVFSWSGVAGAQDSEKRLLKNDLVSFSSKEIASLTSESGFVSVAFSRDADLIATGDLNGLVIIRNWPAGTEKMRFNSDKMAAGPLKFSPNGAYLAANASDGSVWIWDIGGERRILKTAPLGGLIGFLSEGREFLVLTKGLVQTRDVKTGKVTKEIRIGMTSSSVYRPTISADGKTLAAGHVSKAIKIWKADSGEDVISLKGFEKLQQSLCFSQSGKRLASAGADKMVRVWDTKSGDLLHSTPVQGMPTSLAFSPDEKWLAVSFASPADQISIRDAGSGKEFATIKHVPGVPKVLTINSKGNLLACATAKTVQVWELSYRKVDQK